MQVQTIFIESSVKTQLVMNLGESLNLDIKSKDGKLEAYKAFNAGLNEAKVSYASTKFGKGELNGLFIVNDANFKTIEAQFMQLVETAKQDLSIEPTKEATPTWLVPNNKPKSVFEAKKAEISTAKLTSQQIAENCLKNKSLPNEAQFKQLDAMERKSNEIKAVIAAYQFSN